VRGDLESLFLLAFSEEEFLAALAMASSEAFFNKLLIERWVQFARHLRVRLHKTTLNELSAFLDS
jgi:hypothetical protein